MATTTEPPVTRPRGGLEGVVAATTAIGDVRGHEGSFHYRGYDATELAAGHTLEEVWQLLLVGHLPTPAEHRSFLARIETARRRLPAELLRVTAATTTDGDRMAGLRTAWSQAAEALGCRPWGDLRPAERLDQAIALSAVGPLVVAAVHGRDVASVVGELPASTAATHLQLVGGQPPPAELIVALDRYLVLTLDHGLNASTFTTRIVTSTGADLGAVLVAALGALSGPLHGGAPSRALDMLDAIATPDRAERWVGAALDRGERLMGFGHRVYRTEDPRARALRATARELGGERVALAQHVEQVIRRQLRERRPDRVLDVNVEYYAAVVLEAVGLPASLFTPTFALARSIGWMAHALEQMEDGRIVRPASAYVGPAPGRTVPASVGGS